MSTDATALFREHPRTWQRFRFCYPVISRRSRGLSIGVNVNPDKACNFDCAYCSVDRSVPPTDRAVDEPVLLAELGALLDLAADGSIWSQAPFDATPPKLRRLNDVAFSGDGEPTSYAGFPRLADAAGRLLDERGLGSVKLVVITNATLFHRATVRDALVALAARPSEVWAKLDAGTEDWYRQVDRSDVLFQRILDNLLLLGRLRPIVIQSLFCTLRGVGPSEAEIDAWAGRITKLVADGAQIERVQVYTTARKTAEGWVGAVESVQLHDVARRAHGMGIETVVFGP